MFISLLKYLQRYSQSTTPELVATVNNGRNIDFLRVCHLPLWSDVLPTLLLILEVSRRDSSPPLFTDEERAEHRKHPELAGHPGW